MYSEAEEVLQDCISSIEQNNYKEAARKASLMEAELPVCETEINRIASRFVTKVSNFRSSKASVNRPEEASKILVTVGEEILQAMRTQEIDSRSVHKKLHKFGEYVSIGDVERVSEDSAWGKIARSYIEGER